MIDDPSDACKPIGSSDWENNLHHALIDRGRDLELAATKLYLATRRTPDDACCYVKVVSLGYGLPEPPYTVILDIVKRRSDLST